MTIQVTLYTKPGCHLCEQALADLARLRRRFPHELRLVDITTEPELMRDYGERIPVLSINGREQSAPLLAAILEREMRRASGGDD
jgi:glutaredoxin